MTVPLEFMMMPPQTVLEKIKMQFAGLGYRGELWQENYSFEDWFLPDNPKRIAPAVAFGRTPLAYDSACFVLLFSSDAISGSNLIGDFRAIGAPLALVVSGQQFALWSVGRNQETTKLIQQFDAGTAVEEFRNHADEWSPMSVLRAKTIAPAIPGVRQLDFFDLGLIPALEAQITPKLDRLLRDVLASTQQAHLSSTGRKADPKKLFPLIFRLLAAKVLHDRNEGGFGSLNERDAEKALEMVKSYYDSSSPIIEDKHTRTIAAELLWKSLDFRHLSVEVLAYIYENTLVDSKIRQRLSTHSTPHAIARYIVRHLPFNEIAADRPLIVEPCSGYGIFLVASLQRLREMMPPSASAEERHTHFVKVLRGFEVDSFAYEVSKLCLMLADLPNHNGWKLRNIDVFMSDDFLSSVKEASVVLCNPPFRKFTKPERVKYGDLRSVFMPAEIIHRVLDNLGENAMIGFVLPNQFTDGKNYRDVRKRIAESFEHVEIVNLPERDIFYTSQHPAVLLLATGNLARKAHLSVAFVQVSEKDKSAFLCHHSYTRRDEVFMSPEEAEKSLAVAPLSRLWKELVGRTDLSSIAEIHRGIAWKEFDPDVCYSLTPKPGYHDGYGRADDADLQQFIAPRQIYLNVDPKNIRRGYNHAWEKPKVIVNAARISVGTWRYAAFLDEEGFLCSQRFHGLWPKGEVALETIAALLNCPLAAAFVATHESGRDITKETLKAIPIPEITDDDQLTIRQLVQEYMLRRGMSDAAAFEVLCELDAHVLRMYSLSSSLVYDLMDFFDGYNPPLGRGFRENFFEGASKVFSELSKELSGDEIDQRETWHLLRHALQEKLN
jgi:hypothetical protein